jgi:hypothetical protein
MRALGSRLADSTGAPSARTGVGKALDVLIHSGAMARPSRKTSALQIDGGESPIAAEATVFGPESTD